MYSKGKKNYLSINEKDATVYRTADLRKVKLGRYPFEAGIKYYVARRSPYLSECTLREDELKLRMFSRLFMEMSSKGMITTTDPRHIKISDIEAFLVWMKKRKLDPTSKKFYLKVLNKYLGLWGNDVIVKMYKSNPTVMPRELTKEIKALSMVDLRKIFDAADHIEGWRGITIAGILALAFGTGCRPKEMRTAENRDLDLANARYFVRHPKGEESWAQPQWIPIIRGDVMHRLSRYTVARDEEVCSVGNNPYLFFNPQTGMPYTPNAINRMIKDVRNKSGVDFSLKHMRSTLCSITIDGDLSKLKAVSLQLRHSRIATTEGFYARIAAGAIEKEIGDVWKKNRLE